MKKIIIDGYEIIVDNGVFTNAIFRDYDGKEINIELGEKLQVEFQERRKEEFRRDYEKRKHIDLYLNNEFIKEIKTADDYSIEDEIINNDLKEQIIKEIWKLPAPQNRRVFMKVINGFSYAKIARVEGVAESSVKSSILIGQEKLKKFLKNF